VGTPRVLFEVSEGFEDFDVTSDGDRFIVVSNVVDRYSEPLTVILNWREKLRKSSR